MRDYSTPEVPTATPPVINPKADPFKASDVDADDNAAAETGPDVQPGKTPDEVSPDQGDTVRPSSPSEYETEQPDTIEPGTGQPEVPPMPSTMPPPD